MQRVALGCASRPVRRFPFGHIIGGAQCTAPPYSGAVADGGLDDLVDELAGIERALVVGGVASTIGRELERRGAALDVITGDWPSIQLDRRYDLAVVGFVADVESADSVAAVHCAVQHLTPDGRLVIAGDGADGLGGRFGLVRSCVEMLDSCRVTVFRRTARRTIHDVVFAARQRLDRITATELAGRLAGRGAPTVVDTRTATDRHRHGVIAGSLHVPRTVLEWHLDPANGYQHRDIRTLDQPLVVVCNGGYSSALAAASLLDLGFSDVTDLIGGMRAWIGAGFPVVAPDHTHLDL